MAGFTGEALVAFQGYRSRGHDAATARNLVLADLARDQARARATCLDCGGRPVAIVNPLDSTRGWCSQCNALRDSERVRFAAGRQARVQRARALADRLLADRPGWTGGVRWDEDDEPTGAWICDTPLLTAQRAECAAFRDSRSPAEVGDRGEWRPVGLLGGHHFRAYVGAYSGENQRGEWSTSFWAWECLCRHDPTQYLDLEGHPTTPEWIE